MAMGLYRDHILPHLIHLSMRQRNLAAYRARVLPAAQGRVLEIGIGSGLNLPYYSTTVEQVIGLDPSPKLLGMAREAARRTSLPLELIENSAEAIPLYNRSIDTVVTTWTMCSIPDVQRALGEMRRVLKPEGRLLFVEHGLSPDPGIRRWQDRLTPVWRRVGGGCHLNRAIGELIEEAGFRIERLETGYMRGPKPMTFMYEGSARPC
jgi:ubiquinone/menaquinone biosynthesis C-methylase UbiE